MTTWRKVTAAPLFPHDLDLFCNAYNAWEHMVKHVFGAGESCHWGVLIPALQSVLSAGQRDRLRDLASGASPDGVPLELTGIWPAFLKLVAAATKGGVQRGWYWEEEPTPGDGPYKVFAPSGILTCLDSTRVRTGFLPFKDDLPSGLVRDQDRRYQLFQECWKKVRFKYKRALQGGRVVDVHTALDRLMREGMDQATWEGVQKEEERP